MQKRANGIVRTPVEPLPAAPPDAVSRIAGRSPDSTEDSTADSKLDINPGIQRQRQSRKRAPDRKPVMFHMQPAIHDALARYCSEYGLVKSAVVEDAVVAYLAAAEHAAD